MKTLKALCVIGLITVIAGSAFGYNGPVKWNIVNWDMGPVYDPTAPALAGGVPVIGEAAVDALPQFAAPGTFGNEDDWGIFRIQEILTDDGFNNLLFHNGDGGKELVGLFYGGVDNAIVLNTVTGEQTIQSAGWHVAVFMQDVGTLSNAAIAAGSAGRVAFDQFVGVGYDALNVLNSSAVLVLAGDSVTGVTPIAGSNPALAHTISLFTPDTSGTTGTGKGDSYFDITSGLWQPFYEYPGAYFPSSPDGDLYAKFTATPNPDGAVGGAKLADWTVTTDDPVRGFVVPEPATMGLVMLSVSGLAGYIRKRRA